MAPAKTALRSRRTQSSDASAVRPVYEWPDHPEDSVIELRDAGREHHHRTSPRASPTAGMGRKLYEGDEDNPGVDTRAASRAVKPTNHGNHLGTKIIKKINYDSDSCLTPRSRRTLRRTLSGVTEPWPSVSSPAAKPTLDTIYSPTHEILHPMQSLMLEKSLDSPAAGIGQGKPLTVSFVTVRATSQGHFTPTRMTQSVDFDSSFKTSQHRQQQPLELESYALNNPGQGQQELDSQDDDSTPTAGDGDLAEQQLARASNTVVIIVNAEKKPTKLAALDWAINVAAQPGDEIVILGVLKHVSTPMGSKVVANTEPGLGVSQELLKSETTKITEVFEQMVSDSGRRAECEKKNVKLTVRIAPGARARTVVVRELAALKATYAVFDRRILRGTRYYNKHLSCHAVRMRSNGRSTKTIFTTATTTTSKWDNSLTPTPTPTTTPPWQLNSSSTGHNSSSSYYSGSSPTSEASGSSPSGSNSSSPTHFWRRFTPFKTSVSKAGSKRNLWSPRAALSPAGSEVASPGFMSEMQEFSIALDTDGSIEDIAAGSQQRSRPGSKLALESCVAVDARAYKAAMDSHRVKHRPVSITIPTICAT